MLQGGEDLLKHEHASGFTKPLLVVHGSGDVVNSHHASKQFVDMIPSLDKTYQEYDAGYHELHNDLGRDQVIQDCIHWIISRVKTSTDGNSKL